MIAMTAQSVGAQAATDQRETAVRLAAAYPANPLDAALDREATAAAGVLQAAPDNPVVSCSDRLPWMEKKKYKYNHELSVAYVLGAGAYALQHAEVRRSRRYYPGLMAGSQAALRAYESILAQDPKARLDNMSVWSDQMRSGEFRRILFKNCALPNPALSRSKDPLTPEERRRIVALAEEMQKDPIDLALKPEYQELFVVVAQASDISVNLCPSSSPWIDEKPEYKYGSDLLALNLMAMASYVLRNPDTGKSGLAHGRAGLIASLRGYEAVLKQDPGAKSAALDAALEREKQGKLDDWYKEQYAARCKNK